MTTPQERLAKLLAELPSGHDDFRHMAAAILDSDVIRELLAEAEQRGKRVAEHLVSTELDGRQLGHCDLTSDSGGGRCKAKPVALRWEDGFADYVCEKHAESAKARGALIVYPKHHDGQV